MKKTTALVLIILTLGCASHKKTNKLAAEIDCNKNFFLAYDERSDFEKFKYEGLPTFGDSKFPDFRQSFIKSINELDKDTEMQIKFVNSNILPSNSVTFAKVRIEDILYQMENSKILLTGKNKMNVGFTKKGSLYKALKNGHYLFISSICSQ